MSDTQLRNHRAIMTALINGESVRVNGENIFKFYGNTLTRRHISSKIWSYHNLDITMSDEWEIYTELQWYDNIPEQGVLCWVSDVKDNYSGEYNTPVIITSRAPEEPFPFRTITGTGWKYATPITPTDSRIL